MKRFLGVLLIVVMMVSLAACGGAGDSSETQSDGKTQDVAESQDVTEAQDVTESQEKVKEISILTPYLSSVTTNEMAETMKANMGEKGWSVTVVDTKGDVAMLASRMEDVISAKVDAIVIVSTDPNQVATQIEKAVEANIPVFGCDSAFIEGMVLNATSDNYAMGEMITNYLFEKMGGKGSVIALTHRPHPGVLKRCEAFDDLLAKNPDIELITEQHVEVPGPIENSRQIMENLILSNPEKDSIAAVWCAWDEPAIGVSQALADAGRNEVLVVGVDGNSQAVEMIQNGSTLIATVAQNFKGMAEIVTNEMERVFNGEAIDKGDRYAPASIIDNSNK